MMCLPAKLSITIVVVCVLLATSMISAAEEPQQAKSPQQRKSAKRRVRGSQQHHQQGVTKKESPRGRRQLFAERWDWGSDRGGAGAAAKGLEEFLPMRITPLPVAPVVTTPAPVVVTTPAPVPVPVITAPPIPVFTVPPTPPPQIGLTAPTPSPGAPRNDVCANARPIDPTAQGLGQTRAIIYNDSTINAQVCSSCPSTCGVIVNNAAPSAWFRVVGTGDRMWVSTCHEGTTYDTQLTVYDGSCGSLSCVFANDDAGGTTFGACQGNTRASRVQWDSDQGTTYYIQVHGFLASRQGTFQINVLNAAPLNDLCDTAENINVGDTVVGTTFQARVPFGGDSQDGISLQCQGSSGTFLVGMGVWYRVMGNGGTITADTCNPLTDFDTKLNIFEGSCSTRNACIAVNDNSKQPERCSTISWQAASGQEYYILVNGFLTANGLFELSVR